MESNWFDIFSFLTIGQQHSISNRPFITQSYTLHIEHILLSKSIITITNIGQYHLNANDPHFFNQALTLLLTEIRKRTEIRIINYSDDLLLLHQEKKLAFLPKTTYNQYPGALLLNIRSKQVPISTEIRDRLPPMHMKNDRNKQFHDKTQKAPINRIYQTVYQEHTGTQNQQNQRNSSSNRKIELLENSIQRNITLSNANRLSQNQSSQNTKLDRSDGHTARSPEGTLLMDQKNSRKQEIIDIRPNSTSNISNRCLTPRVGSNTRTRFWRGSSSSRSMSKLPDTLDEQQERTAGNSFRNNSFRKSLQRAADNQSPNLIRQLFCNIRFKKAESNRHFSTGSEGHLPNLPTFEHKNNNITRIRKDKHNNRCSQQIMQIRRRSSSPIISGSNKNDLEHRTNS
ncbi:MAG: hypothetical protein EZS28_015989 [Streblomastix strix]|uniref:Uncharacterized protein n=1 Tax=Streblomastix strix TaxID=222440 RepID=A0A5J4W114_9EUKA|nr:MAG: hypothetical protein EZS28_015989 [Streblomastix strix]